MTAIPLSRRLRDATQPMHRIAERSGLMARLLQGTLDRDAYVAFLRDLHALYVALERGLAQHATHPLVAPIRMPLLDRAGPLAADLDAWAGPASPALRAGPHALAYAAHLDGLARDWPAGLVAHAYVRYLGDLSGGRLVGEIIRRTFAIEGARGLSFYAFAGNVQTLKARFRQGLDTLPADAEAKEAIVAEAVDAFARHVAWFEALEGRGAATAQSIGSSWA